MDSRNNVIAMMVLGAGIVALGGSILSGEIFKAEKPEKPGYIVEGVEAEAGAGPAVAEVPIATLLAAADPAKGADVFKKCASCHSIAQGGANGIGPNLWGTLGEEIGKGKGGYAFSEVLSGKGGKWDFESMNAWLKNPKAFAPGTKMSFAGLSKGEDRANLLAYINTQGSNLPLPAAPAAAETPAAATPAGEPAPAVKPKA
jgi:cytochrome c